jgi:hypothetical protein
MGKWRRKVKYHAFLTLTLAGNEMPISFYGFWRGGSLGFITGLGKMVANRRNIEISLLEVFELKYLFFLISPPRATIHAHLTHIYLTTLITLA